MAFFTEVEQIVKTNKHMEPLKNSQTILRKTNRIGDITLSAFRPCYKDTIIKIEWHRKRQIDQQNRIKSLEAYTHT